MRDPKRIRGVLRSLEAVWTTFPDMRLCQLLSAIHGMEDAFYLEDEKLLAAILKFSGERGYVVTPAGRELLGGGK